MTFFFSTLLTSFIACGSDSEETETVQQESTTLTLGVSDGAVDNAQEVNIFASKIVVQSTNGDTLEYSTLDVNGQPTKINLLDFQGSDAFTLINSWQLTEGDYEWIRMDIVNGDATAIGNGILMSSYVLLDDASIVPLVIKRKGNDGIGEIQLNDLHLNQGSNHFVVEFDLKKSLVRPQHGNEINLKPTGVRLQNTIESGTVYGSVEADVVADCESLHASLANESGSFSHSVYLYEDTVTAQTAEDINDVSANTPVATAALYYNSTTGNYDYEIGFLAEGDYTLGYTCLAHLDNPDTQETIELHGFTTGVAVDAENDFQADITESLPLEATVESTEAE